MPAQKEKKTKKKPQNNQPTKKRNSKRTPIIYKVYLYYFAHKILLSTPARFTADLSYVNISLTLQIKYEQHKVLVMGLVLHIVILPGYGRLSNRPQ